MLNFSDVKERSTGVSRPPPTPVPAHMQREEEPINITCNRMRPRMQNFLPYLGGTPKTRHQSPDSHQPHRARRNRPEPNQTRPAPRVRPRLPPSLVPPPERPTQVETNSWLSFFIPYLPSCPQIAVEKEPE